MIDINKYKDHKVYIALESKIDDNDVTEEDRVDGGAIYHSLDEVMESASEGDEFVEIEISKQFKAMNKCMTIVEIKDKKIVAKS
jgi:hypothetical protein